MDFQSTTFSGIEGDSVSVCIIITNGSVELLRFVNVELVATDITTIGMYRLWYYDRRFMNCTPIYTHTIYQLNPFLCVCIQLLSFSCLILPS